MFSANSMETPREYTAEDVEMMRQVLIKKRKVVAKKMKRLEFERERNRRLKAQEKEILAALPQMIREIRKKGKEERARIKEAEMQSEDYLKYLKIKEENKKTRARLGIGEDEDLVEFEKKSKARYEATVLAALRLQRAQMRGKIPVDDEDEESVGHEIKSYQLVSPPTSSATVPEVRSEPPKQDNVEKIFPTDDSVEQEKKSRKRSRQPTESSDTDIPPDKAKNLVSEREKQLRLQDRIKKVAENNRKIEEFSQSNMKKLDEKAKLSTEVKRVREEIGKKSEMCQKRKRGLQAKKDKNLERGRVAKNRMDAELEKMKIGNELADFNFNDTENWLDVLKKRNN
ncbi:hypothetical protein CAEBREN_18849 [Caenorhabditis brenneri]|uniref:Uncharacterized protein n=1 Tax=Caenorhabditis brenneri TaxID=135651 RepID=G0NV46_CAEBE|nr:hypothetical protein CAEBREN_18849 [Caenorhabditis brenneri]